MILKGFHLRFGHLQDGAPALIKHHGGTTEIMPLSHDDLVGIGEEAFALAGIELRYEQAAQGDAESEVE